jgi:alpha-ketoglutarate-dependent taurine dioxygenase
MLFKLIAAALPLFTLSATEDIPPSYVVDASSLPAIVTPTDSELALHAWMKNNKKKLKALVKEHGGILLRGFPVNSPEDFAYVVKAVLGKEPITYRSGEGSRTKIAEGVYTSTEAPPQYQIPLHNELTCTDNPVSYICFYCETAPAPGSGQTNLGYTERASDAIKSDSELWDLFNGKTLKYISRHPPEGNYFTWVNNTHRTWQDTFETNDKSEVENICREKGFEFHWLGEWIEVIRRAPAIHAADKTFDHPYWYNQAHLYHSNPRIRGGYVNDFLANLVYSDPTTRQYDIEFDDGTQIPQEAIYRIYDIMEEQTIQFDWKKGDVLLLDNKQILHGRAPYFGPRRILVSMVQ